jgi:hypothetical protein
MRNWLLALCAALILFPGAALPESAVPFGEEETLHYTVNWPSGLSLGECEMSARLIQDTEGERRRWNFEFKLDAAVPGFGVLAHFRSSATDELCSLELEKDSSRGKRKARERTSFDSERGVARRVTLGGGGESEISVPACPKDGLTFLYFLRRELSRGRLPPPQTILFGAPYDVAFQYTGSQLVQVAGSQTEADRLVVSLKGPASEHTFEFMVARDAARTPVLIKVPLPLGNFSLELAP